MRERIEWSNNRHEIKSNAFAIIRNRAHCLVHCNLLSTEFLLYQGIIYVYVHDVHGIFFFFSGSLALLSGFDLASNFYLTTEQLLFLVGQGDAHTNAMPPNRNSRMATVLLLLSVKCANILHFWRKMLSFNNNFPAKRGTDRKTLASSHFKPATEKKYDENIKCAIRT